MELLEEYLCGILAKYCVDEKCIVEELPEIRIVESIWMEIENLRPDIAKKLDRDEIEKCSGHVLFLDDETGVILIDKIFFLDSIRKNFCWVEVLTHEITHYRDFKSNLGIFGHNTFDSMLTCLPFWYWTEFHARYKGTIHMLYYVNCLPDDERRKYEANVKETLDIELVFITSDAAKEMRRYRFMHLLADIAAYNETGFSISCGGIEKIFPDHLGYIEFLKSRDKIVDIKYLTILDFNLREHIR